jgi:hypothetical protein
MSLLWFFHPSCCRLAGESFSSVLCDIVKENKYSVEQRWKEAMESWFGAKGVGMNCQKVRLIVQSAELLSSLRLN